MLLSQASHIGLRSPGLLGQLEAFESRKAALEREIDAVPEALPRLHRSAASSAWGPLCEGVAFGAIVGLVIAASGSGGEFIYFQF